MRFADDWDDVTPLDLTTDGVVEMVQAADEAMHRLPQSSADTLFLELEPCSTKELLNMNDGRHHNRWARAKFNKFWMSRTTEAGNAWQEHYSSGLPHWERVHVEVVFIYGCLRKRDTHNLMPTAKSIMDAIVQMGVVPDDNDKLVIGPDLRPALDRRLGANGCQLVAKVRPLAEAEFIWWEEGI